MPAITKFTVWTDAERQLIHDRYFVMYPDRSDPPTDRKVRNAANAVLPPDRQRDHISPNDPVKKLIYTTLGQPMPIKNQKRYPKAKRSTRRYQLKADPASRNSQPNRPVATLQHTDLSNLVSIRRRTTAIIMAATQILADLD
jgi:hypothetical protein